MQNLQQVGGGATAPPNPAEEATIELGIPDTSPDPTPPPPPPPPTVRVRVANGRAQCYVDGALADNPSAVEVIRRLPAPHNKMRLRNYEDLQDKIGQNVSLLSNSQWADAIGQALIQRLANGQEGQFESTPLQDPNAFLAIGDQLYKLIPTAVVRTNGALAAARRRSIEKAREESTRILSEAQANANALMTRARAELNQAEDIRRRASIEIPPPTWAMTSGLPLRFAVQTASDRFLWEIGISLRIRLNRYDYTYSINGRHTRSRTWYPTVTGKLIYLPVWVPVENDQFVVSSIHVDKDLKFCHPHMTAGQACMELGIPSRLRNMVDYRLLSSTLHRTLSAAQLNSLLTYVENWMPFTEGMPFDLLKALERGPDELKKFALDCDTREGITDSATPAENVEEEFTA